MGRHSIPGPGDPRADAAEPVDSGSPPSGRIPRADASWQGRRRATDAGRRGVSVGAIAVLVLVVVLVGGVIAWRFFGDALSRRSADAAQQCIQGTADVAVVADPSIAGDVATFAQRYNAEASPVGDKCVNVVVTEAGSDAVLSGLTGGWPEGLRARPALWIPASSIPSARLQSAIGAAAVSDARSLVTSPVLLAVRPELKQALGEQTWAGLPGLQSNPAGLDGLNLGGWGTLRMALPSAGAADAGVLAAEAVAVSSAPPGAPATAGLPAAAALMAGQPQLADGTADTAWQWLIASGDPAAAPVHAVALTEQQLYRRTADLPDAASTVTGWLPAGPVAVADYPTVLLAGDWLADEQVAAASEFARFMRKPEQLATLTESGFRVDGTQGTPPKSAVVDFGPLGERLPTGDDGVRGTLAGALAPGAVAATTVMLNRSLDPAVIAALRDRVAALPPGAALGLWTFDGTAGTATVPFGPLSDQIDGRPRQTALTDALNGVATGSSGAVSFTTLRLVYGDALTNYRPGQQNSVLIITTGTHTDRSLDGPGLQDFIKSALDPKRPVEVNIIDLGADSDRSVWETVAQLTGGSYAAVPAADSPELVAALSRMMS